MIILQVINCAMLLTLILLIVYVGMCVDYAINMRVHQAMQNLDFTNITNTLQEIMNLA